MKHSRYKELMNDHTLKLTDDEIAEGWWFCVCEWDGLLIHSSWAEAKFCGCHPGGGHYNEKAPCDTRFSS